MFSSLSLFSKVFDSTVRDESLAAILIPFLMAYDRERGQYVVEYSTDTGVSGVSKVGKLAHRYVLLLLLVICSAGAGGFAQIQLTSDCSRL